mmetsp:Transcript_14033/g.43872  ORF Transcript_14033/g.43872 Transcript_14033/m.43872 type:complete len:84 (-) Transcript_14033:590-841(-)
MLRDAPARGLLAAQRSASNDLVLLLPAVAPSVALRRARVWGPLGPLGLLVVVVAPVVAPVVVTVVVTVVAPARVARIVVAIVT